MKMYCIFVVFFSTAQHTAFANVPNYGSFADRLVDSLDCRAVSVIWAPAVCFAILTAQPILYRCDMVDIKTGEPRAPDVQTSMFQHAQKIRAAISHYYGRTQQLGMTRWQETVMAMPGGIRLLHHSCAIIWSLCNGTRQVFLLPLFQPDAKREYRPLLGMKWSVPVRSPLPCSSSCMSSIYRPRWGRAQALGQWWLCGGAQHFVDSSTAST